jgi:perosamine synthetase
VDDAAQTLRPHGTAAFTSISFQASKILSLGEGGMLATDDEGLAERARSYLSLGYRMGAGEARIDPATLKSPTYERHHRIGVNGRMNDITAAEGLRQLAHADELLAIRRECAEMYRDAIAGCEWLTPQYVPPGWHHDWWTWAVAVNADDDLWETGLDLTPAEQAQTLADAIVAHGGERPFAAWRITYQEPALRHLAPDGTCPVAESLQPRLLQMQTNHVPSAERNARALRLAIKEVG